VTDRETLVTARETVSTVRVAEPVRAYVTRLAAYTREHAHRRQSPRDDLVARAAQARAVTNGREYVTPTTCRPRPLSSWPTGSRRTVATAPATRSSRRTRARLCRMRRPRRLRLTLRGWTVVVTVVVAVALSWGFGPRALNAIVVPLVVVLLAGLVTAVRIDRPRVDRQPVSEGFIGEQRRVEVAIETDGPIAATVRDTVGDGLVDRGTRHRDDEGDETVTYDVGLEARGRHRVGPLSIVVSDIVGPSSANSSTRRGRPCLSIHAFTIWTVARPPIFGRSPASPIGATARSSTTSGSTKRGIRSVISTGRPRPRAPTASQPSQSTLTTRRSEPSRSPRECRSRRFDEFADRDDEWAAATASVVTVLLERGAPVGLSLPDDETQQPGDGREHHRELLGLLAVAGPGELDDWTRQDADVLVRTDADGTTVVVDDREIPDRLRGRDRGRRTEATGAITTRDAARGSEHATRPGRLRQSTRTRRRRTIGGESMSTDSSGRVGDRTISLDTNRTGSDIVRPVALGCVLALTASYVSVLYGITQVVGGSQSLFALVAAMLVAATVLARLIRPRTAAALALAATGIGFGYHLTSAGVNPSVVFTATDASLRHRRTATGLPPPDAAGGHLDAGIRARPRLPLVVSRPSGRYALSVVPAEPAGLSRVDRRRGHARHPVRHPRRHRRHRRRRTRETGAARSGRRTCSRPCSR